MGLTIYDPWINLLPAVYLGRYRCLNPPLSRTSRLNHRSLAMTCNIRCCNPNVESRILQAPAGWTYKLAMYVYRRLEIASTPTPFSSKPHLTREWYCVSARQVIFNHMSSYVLRRLASWPKILISLASWHAKHVRESVRCG